MRLSTRQYFQILTDILQATHRTADTDAVLALIVRHLRDAFDARGCALRVRDPATRELVLRAAAGLSQEYLAKGAVWSNGPASGVVASGPVVITDAWSDPRVQYPDAARREGIRMFMSFPVEILGDVQMELRLYFEEPVSLDDDEIAMINVLAGQGALAIRHSILHRQYFETFRAVSTAIHSGLGVAEILESIAGHITEIMGAKGCIYWIVDEDKKRIQTSVAHGFAYNSLAGADFQTLDRLFRISERQIVHIADARTDERIPDLERLGKRRVASIFGVPFDIAAPYAGVLAVYFGSQRQLVHTEVDFLVALGEQGAIALQKALSYDEHMLQAFRETVETLVLAIEAKDTTTHGHSMKVAEYARQTALEMGLPALAAEQVHQAGLLHDIGKIGIAGRTLNRLGRLNTKEHEIIKLHPVIGERIVRRLSFMADIAPLILYHHERYDGSGYPEGLSGDRIPQAARILAACDAFDTMISGRPKMPRLKLDDALSQLRHEAGKGFDPDVVAALIRVVEKHPDRVRPAEFDTDYMERLRARLIAPPPRRKVDHEIFDRFMPGF
ncbi:MAG: HD domain-containing phosphohydrolase [Pseudomonadota bacterium]